MNLFSVFNQAIRYVIHTCATVPYRSYFLYLCHMASSSTPLSHTACYGSVRAALGLGAGATELPPTSNEPTPHSEHHDEVVASLPLPTQISDADSFWNAIYNNPNSMDENTDTEVSTEVLRARIIESARVDMSRQNQRRKNCPKRRLVEQRITEQWKKTPNSFAGATK